MLVRILPHACMTRQLEQVVGYITADTVNSLTHINAGTVNEQLLPNYLIALVPVYPRYNCMVETGSLL